MLEVRERGISRDSAVDFYDVEDGQDDQSTQF